MDVDLVQLYYCPKVTLNNIGKHVFAVYQVISTNEIMK